MKHLLILFIILFKLSDLYSQIEDCSTCNEKKLGELELQDKIVEELRLLRNEIYARNGYVFSNQQFARYFENQNWYKPLNNNSITLSTIATENINLIKKIEEEELKKRTKALNDLNRLKNALNTNNKEVIKNYISEQKLEDQWGTGYDSYVNGLKVLLTKIDLEDIHWNKGSGFYECSIDNGYSVNSVKLIFTKTTIRIGGGEYSHSVNFGDFDDGYSDYMSEGENQSFWIFKVTEDGLVFDHLEILG